jgi:hypothetical protein
MLSLLKDKNRKQLKDLFFIKGIKDKKHGAVERYVLHKGNEGQKAGRGRRICPS